MKYIIVDENIHYYIIYHIIILILVYSVIAFNVFHVYIYITIYNYTSRWMFINGMIFYVVCETIKAVCI